MQICILDALTLGDDVDLSIFDRLGTVSIYPTTQPDEVVERIKDQEVVITNKVVLNKANLQHAKQLQLICVAATGTNNIDVQFAQSRNIKVTNVSAYSTPSVAQHTFALLFYLLESLPYYDQYVKSGHYARSKIFTHLDRPYWELKGKRWGIIGLGTIGKEVARLAQAFGCQISYYSTSGQNNDPLYHRVELDELLQSSDFISIHAPLNEYTQDLIRYEHFKKMPPHAILLNLGRGGIVNEEDLARALDEELIYGAALDVLSSEPIAENNPLLKIKNSQRLLITPHIAWASVEARQRLIFRIAENIQDFISEKQA